MTRMQAIAAAMRPAHVPAVDSRQVHCRMVSVMGHQLFYRDAGPREAPVILLLHGFPSSSHMFRNLIPELAERYRVLAPDLPGFGFTVSPGPFEHSFAHMAAVMSGFMEALGVARFAVYVFDYGAPVGFRMALAHPERITAWITQNGNAYEEGLGKGFGLIRQYGAEPTESHRSALRQILTPDSIREQYLDGVPDPSRVAPESYTLDAALLSRPGNDEIQLDYFLDYRSNLDLYPAFQEYFRNRHPALLAVWGQNDTIFVPAGARAFKRDLPDAEMRLYVTGHFALETHAREIGAVIRGFLGRKL
jgi:pimeloyl-ACP methyl ester carboxylesterase